MSLHFRTVEIINSNTPAYQLITDKGGGNWTKERPYVRHKMNGPKFDPYSTNFVPLQCRKTTSFKLLFNKPNFLPLQCCK